MRRQLLRGGVAVVAVTLLLFALPLVVVVRQQAVASGLDELAGRLEQTATLLDERARSCAELQVIVRGLDGTGAMQLAVFDRAGALRLAPDRAGAASGAQVAGPEVATAAGGVTASRAVDGQLVAAAPLSTGVCGERLVLWGAGDADAAATAARGSTLVLLLAALAALGLGAVVAVLVGRRLARPMEALAASAARLGDGDFSERAPRSGLPEADAIADALDGTADRLARAVARSSAFAADASHQLRTPLTALRLQLEAATSDDPATAAALEGALQEADRLEATVAELVALTTLEGAATPQDLGALLDSLAPAWRRRAASLGRTVELDLAPAPPRRVRRAAVAQALAVLVDNALAHGTGTVTVSLRAATPASPDDAVRVAVLDEGPGPAPAALEALRGRDMGSAAVPLRGGRGLPLARALVEGERGRLVAERRDGRTAMVVLLPGDERAHDLDAA